MMKIITTFKPDGTKTRRPVGTSGEQCNVATAPYEAFDIPGQVKKTLTADFDRTPECGTVEQQQTTSREN